MSLTLFFIEGRFRLLREGAAMSDTSGYDTILVERDGPIAVVTLNRPKSLNALNAMMIRELAAAFDELDADASIRVVILTGAGDRAFAAGADISELKDLGSAAAGAALVGAGQALTLQLERLSKPVVAAVNGLALGGGCELALACDIRIAGNNARFGQPEVNLGLMPGFGGTQRTARLLGRGTAMFICLSGEPLAADDAYRIGLCERVVPAHELMEVTRHLATVIASKAPLAVAATKRAIDEGIGLPLHEGLAIEARHFSTLINTHDFVEGTTAFLEKRPPRFSGS